MRVARIQWIAIVLAAASLAAVAHAEAPAGLYVVRLDSDQAPVFDLSGAVSTTFDLSDSFVRVVFDVSAAVVQDARGRIAGTATAVNVPDSDVTGFITCSVKGRIRGVKRMTVLRLDLDCAGTLALALGNQPARMKLRRDLRIDHRRDEYRSKTRLRGSIGGQALRLDAEERDSGRPPLVGDRGFFDLEMFLGLDPGNGTAVFGAAAARVPTANSERSLHFGARGRFNEKHDRSRLTLKSVAKGSKISLHHAVVRDGALVGGKIRWKLMGQKGSATLVP